MHSFRFPLAAGALLLALALLAPRASHAAYAPSDLAGTWRTHSIASGPGGPWWERGLATITSAGALTSYAIDNFGELDTTQFQLALDAAGIVTVPVAPVFHGALDMGLTVFAASDTWNDGPGAGSSEIKLAVKQVGSYRITDLAGAWEMNSIASGPSAPWWFRGRLTIQPNGALIGSFTESTGDTSTGTGNMAVASDGGVTLSLAPLALGHVDAGRTVLAMTNTWFDGSVELATGLRMAASYTQADLAGTWQVHTLATGPGAPWWSHGQVVVQSNGVFSGSMMENSGDTFPVGGTFTLASNGVITRAGSTVARGVLDRGHTVMVWTDTWDTGSPGTTEMMIGVRTDGSRAAVPPISPGAFALEPVRPNPARAGALAIRFALVGGADAGLELLDVAGRTIDARDVGALGAGAHVITLAAAARLSPGLYFVRLREGTQQRVERVTVLR